MYLFPGDNLTSKSNWEYLAFWAHSYPLLWIGLRREISKNDSITETCFKQIRNHAVKFVNLLKLEVFLMLFRKFIKISEFRPPNHYSFHFGSSFSNLGTGEGLTLINQRILMGGLDRKEETFSILSWNLNIDFSTNFDLFCI